MNFEAVLPGTTTSFISGIDVHVDVVDTGSDNQKYSFWDVETVLIAAAHGDIIQGSNIVRKALKDHGFHLYLKIKT